MVVTKRFLRKLKKIVGPEHLGDANEDLIAYSYDATVSEAMPDVIARPASLDEVVKLVKAAGEMGVPVVPRGAGTGLSGGSLAVRGGLIVHLGRMNRLKDLNRRDMVAVVEPGLINWELKKAAAAAGLFYPPDPSSMKVCTLGGNVAENAGGPCGAKYGVTADYVLGLEAVLSSGEIIRTGGATRRNVSGYDLTRLLVGSEGTLALITEITLRLLPRPPARKMALFAFDDIVSAGEAVVGAASAGVTPAAVEIMDRTAIECAERYRPGRLPREVEALLLVEVDGEPDGVKAQMAGATRACLKAGGHLIRQAETDAAAEQLWDARRDVSAALGRMGTAKVGEDVSVPVSRLPEMTRRIREISERHNLTIALFGHAGDGNLHPNILAERRDPEIMKAVEAAVTEIFEAAVSLGGTLSGEHGIGSLKAPYMKYAVPPATLEAMKKIKRALDPAGIMNPGKIFP